MCFERYTKSQIRKFDQYKCRRVSDSAETVHLNTTQKVKKKYLFC